MPNYIEYIGSLTVSGVMALSTGQTAALSGSIGIDLGAALSPSGNGPAYESITGSLSYTYAGSSGINTGTLLPINVFHNDFTITNGQFQTTVELPASVPGVEFGITLSGSLGLNQQFVSTTLSGAFDGNYKGLLFAGNIAGSGRLGTTWTLPLPSIKGVHSGPQATDDPIAIAPFAGVYVSDPNTNQMETVAITLSNPANGVLSDKAGGSFDPATGVFRVTAPDWQIGDYLAGLYFQPTPSQLPRGQTVTTQFTITATDTDGWSTTNSSTTVVTTETAPVKTLASFNRQAWVAGGSALTTTAQGYVRGQTLGDNLPFQLIPEQPTLLDGWVLSISGLAGGPNGDSAGVTPGGDIVNFQGGNAEEIEELVLTASGYAPITIQLANILPVYTGQVSAVMDATGDLFGLDGGQASDYGALFEVANSPTGYVTTPVILANFGAWPGNAFGPYPDSELAIDGAGDLFYAIFDNGQDEIFELQRSTAGYAAQPTLLASLAASSVGFSLAIAVDPAGDVFAVSENILTPDTVIAIARVGDGYAPPAILASSNLGDVGSLMVDAAGDLYGLSSDGIDGGGSVFEVAKGPNGYASTVSEVADFKGAVPLGLMADQAGNLYGTTGLGGAFQDGSVFEVVDSGFRTAPSSVPQARSAFHGGGTDDILFQNATSGLLLDWRPSDGVLAAGTPVGGVTPDWCIVGTGDFGGSGSSDILFENNTGLVADWQVSAGTLVAGQVIAGASYDWSVLGTGDFYGTGTDDILFQNTVSGLILDWQMSNGTLMAGNPIAGANFDWKFVGTGDFDGTGTDDILFQNSRSGLVLDWQMANGTLVAGNILGGASGWTAIGTGDFRGGGTDDVLFENNSSGALLYWQISRGAVVTGVTLGTLAAAQHVVGIGDYNGDGTSDVLVQDAASGTLTEWLLSAGPVNAVTLGAAPFGWQVAP